MRSKRARTFAELAREVAADMNGDDAEARDVELAARVERLKKVNLLIDQWDLDYLDADMQWCGISGSPTKVHRVQSIVLTKEGHKEVPSTEEGVRDLIHELIVDHTLG